MEEVFNEPDEFSTPSLIANLPHRFTVPVRFKVKGAFLIYLIQGYRLLLKHIGNMY